MDFYDFGVQCALQAAGLLKQAGIFNPELVESTLLPILRQGKGFGRELVQEGAHIGKHTVQSKATSQVGHLIEDDKPGSNIPYNLAPANSPAQRQLMRR